MGNVYLLERSSRDGDEMLINPQDGTSITASLYRLRSANGSFVLGDNYFRTADLAVGVVDPLSAYAHWNIVEKLLHVLKDDDVVQNAADEIPIGFPGTRADLVKRIRTLIAVERDVPPELLSQTERVPKRFVPLLDVN